MVINPSCVRDLILKLEVITGPDSKSPYKFRAVDAESLASVSEISEKYSQSEINYTLIQLAESGYISMDFKYSYEKLTFKLGNILYLTPKGHEFSANLKSEERWNKKIKPIIASFG